MRKLLLAGFALVLLPSLAEASAPSVADTAASGPATVQQLTVLHNQVAILTQQLAVAKLQNDIASANGTKPDPAVPPAGYAAANPPSTAPAAATTLPSILSISGAGLRLSATLLTPSGSQLVVTPGQALPGGMTVYSVTSTGVEIMQGGNLVPLSFAGTDAVDPMQGAAQAQRTPLTPVFPPMRLPGSN